MDHHEIARACGEEPLCAGAPACYRVAPHAFELSQKWAPEKGPWELAELNFRVPAHLFANNEFIPPSKARMEKIFHMQALALPPIFNLMALRPPLSGRQGVNRRSARTTRQARRIAGPKVP